MTPAQKKWLEVLRETGFVECGGWSRGQRNRPLRALVQMGLAEEGYGPRNSFLKVYGFMPTGDYEASKPPKTETLRTVAAFLDLQPPQEK